MSLHRGIGNVEYMKKRIPKNAKYQHIKTRLDTGCSLSKYMERLEDMKKNYRYRKDEIFKRLKVTTFAQLVLQVASVSDLNGSENDSEHGPDDGLSEVSEADLECLSERSATSPRASPRSDCHDMGDTGKTCYTARSTLLSVISGMGELNLDANHQKTVKELVSGPGSADRPYPDCPYLLLDVRERDLYDRCHIISAHSFPIATLSRTMNPYSKEVLEYKNAPGKIVIVYDEDERIASQAATIMCERGVENLFMLSGGLKVIAQKFPEGMTTGSIPTSCLSSPTSSRRRRRRRRSSSEQQQQEEEEMAERRWRFTADELTKIQEQLEEILIPSNTNSRMSSRMSGGSSSSSQSAASSARSRQGSCTTAGRDSARAQSGRPWK